MGNAGQSTLLDSNCRLETEAEDLGASSSLVAGTVYRITDSSMGG